MKKSVRLPVLALLLVGTFAVHAATDTFPTGKSFWGELATDTSGARAVEPGTRHVRVKYGETVVFRDEVGKQFAWTFNGFDRRAVEVSRIAPQDFNASKTVVHIGQNPLTKR